MTTALAKLCHDSDWPTNVELLKQLVRRVRITVCCSKLSSLPRDGPTTPWLRCRYILLGFFGVQHLSSAGCSGDMGTRSGGCHVGNGLSYFSFLTDIGSSVRTNGRGNERTTEGYYFRAMVVQPSHFLSPLGLG
jgi:hypothetical protein